MVAAVACCAGCGSEAAAPSVTSDGGTRTPSSIGGAAAACSTTPARIADAFPVAAKDGAFFYGFGAQALERLPKAGGAAAALVSGLDPALVRSLAVDGGDAFWLDDGSPGRVFRAPSGGGDAFELALSSRPQQLILDAAHVYWIDADGAAVSRVARRDDLRPQSLLAGAVPGASGQAIAVDAAFVYYAVSYADASGAAIHAVRKVPIAGGAGAEVARLPADVAQLAADDAAIFAASGGTIARIDKLTDVQRSLAAPDPFVDALALDGDRLYFASHDAGGGGHLARAGKDGSALTVLATERVTTPLVIDGDSVYFNAIERVCK